MPSLGFPEVAPDDEKDPSSATVGTPAVEPASTSVAEPKSCHGSPPAAEPKSADAPVNLSEGATAASLSLCLQSLRILQQKMLR